VEDFSALLARFASNLDVSSLPRPVADAAKMNVMDTLACAAAGSSAAAVPEVHRLVSEWGGAPQADIWVLGGRVPAHHAAWINGTMAHARDYDDTHDAAVLHAGVSVIPAALAAAQLGGKTSGERFLAGVVAGLETICRLGMAARITIIDSGYMYTSLFGYFAATLAAARVLGLDEPQCVNALGIVYSKAAGNHQVTRDAALTKRMQPGFAAMAALQSVQLARLGVRGTQSTFEGVDGFFRVYMRDQIDRDSLRDDLGKRFEFARLSYKPYPCCRFNHPCIDAALARRETHSVQPEAVRAIRIGLNHQAYEAVCTPPDVRRAPKTIVQAQFSAPYTIACALVDGAVQLRHFAESSLHRPELLALAGKAQPYEADDIERRSGRNVSPARISIEMEDGVVHESCVDIPLGHPDRPMPDAVIQAKMDDCFLAAARRLDDDAASRLKDLASNLESVADVGELVRRLQPASRPEAP
jgi:2-methylcitrate dehydratase PrpD